VNIPLYCNPASQQKEERERGGEVGRCKVVLLSAILYSRKTCISSMIDNSCQSCGIIGGLLDRRAMSSWNDWLRSNAELSNNDDSARDVCWRLPSADGTLYYKMI
jgi:hypothetical protein